MNVLIKKKDWLMPVTLILFLLTVVLFPFAAERTYAGRNETPDHVLTYTTSNLTWDSATNINADGVAELSLFNSTYQNVQSENGDKVIAPGTEGKNIVRLKNNAGNPIQYVAVMYRMKEEDTLPVEPVLKDDTAFTATTTYPLPDGVSSEQVVSAVTGSVNAREMQDFDITWMWNYYEDEERDIVDTSLGNKAAWASADEVTAGLYLVVMEEESNPGDPDPSDPDPNGEKDTPDSDVPHKDGVIISDPDVPRSDLPDDSDYIYPKVPPNTGDSTNIIQYLVLMVISGVLLLLLMLDRRKEKQCKKS